jgi:hypothetical protein
MKARTVRLVEISQMVSGTRKRRRIEMRFGMVMGRARSRPLGSRVRAYK